MDCEKLYKFLVCLGYRWVNLEKLGDWTFIFKYYIGNGEPELLYFDPEELTWVCGGAPIKSLFHLPKPRSKEPVHELMTWMLQKGDRHMTIAWETIQAGSGLVYWRKLSSEHRLYTIDGFLLATYRINTSSLFLKV